MCFSTVQSICNRIGITSSDIIFILEISQLPSLCNQQLRVYHIYTTIYTQKTWMIRWLAHRQVGDLKQIFPIPFFDPRSKNQDLFVHSTQMDVALNSFQSIILFWLNNITCVIQVCLHQEKNSVSLCQESAYQSNTQQPGVQTCAVECKNIFIQYVLNHRQCNSELNLWPLTSLTTKRKSLFCTPKR